MYSNYAFLRTERLQPDSPAGSDSGCAPSSSGRRAVRPLAASEPTGPLQSVPLADTALMAKFFRERSVSRAIRVLSIFRDELAERMAVLDGIMARRDAKALKDFAHAARGSGAMLGAQRLVAVSRAIESSCIEGRPEWERAECLRSVLLDTRSVYSTFASAGGPFAVVEAASDLPGRPEPQGV